MTGTGCDGSHRSSAFCAVDFVLLAALSADRSVESP